MAESLKNSGSGNQRETGAGVEIKEISDDPRPLKKIYRPNHPDADGEGYVTKSNVNTVEEMVEMMRATRSYEANIAAIRLARDMAHKALEIGK